MTQLAPQEILSVRDVDYEVVEMPRDHESVIAAELAGSLVIAQLVGMDGKPFITTEPIKWRPGMSTEAWDHYVARLKEIKDRPLRTMPPYIGTVRCLGEHASYFALDQLATGTTAHLPFHTVSGDADNPVSYYRLYSVR